MPSTLRTSLLLMGLLIPLQGVAGQLAPRVLFMGQGIVAVDHADPVPGGGSLTEARVVQPVLMLRASALAGHLVALGTLNLEGQTMPHGELLPGGWGEGFTDRRHPHTYAHELILSANDVLGPVGLPVRLSLTAGKGFAPYGSDDPMSRPVFRYPVNHHLAQILERAVVMAGIRAGPLALEGGYFNGDEPERPGQWPLLRRFGDSWTVRLTVMPIAGVELSASRAKVHSPEHRPGAGTDAWKWHLAGRLDRTMLGGRGYLLAEWARTAEAQDFFVFRSVLIEGSYRRGRHEPYYRFEQSDRPEDLRTTDPFRSLRPHLENSIAGITRFSLHTAGYGIRVGGVGGRLVIRPFIEGTAGTMRPVGGGLFDPGQFYGKETVLEVSAGVRVEWRMLGHRMGRYGELLEPWKGAGDGMDAHRM
jgi:hypothetical protein